MVGAPVAGLAVEGLPMVGMDDGLPGVSASPVKLGTPVAIPAVVGAAEVLLEFSMGLEKVGAPVTGFPVAGMPVEGMVDVLERVNVGPVEFEVTVAGPAVVGSAVVLLGVTVGPDIVG
jgi:hypothetical protein